MRHFLLIDLEQVLGARERFGVAKEQIAAIAQREVQQRKHAALGFRLQIDEQVAAAQRSMRENGGSRRRSCGANTTMSRTSFFTR